MTHYLACISEDGTVTVAADVPPGHRAQPPWLVVDEAGLEAMRAEAAASFVPLSVTARQIRLWLVAHGISLAAVDSAIDTIPDQQTRDGVRVEWEYAPYVERAHPMIGPLASALGMTANQVDQAFREAAQI